LFFNVGQIFFFINIIYAPVMLGSTGDIYIPLIGLKFLIVNLKSICNMYFIPNFLFLLDTFVYIPSQPISGLATGT